MLLYLFLIWRKEKVLELHSIVGEMLVKAYINKFIDLCKADAIVSGVLTLASHVTQFLHCKEYQLCREQVWKVEPLGCRRLFYT